MESQHDQFNAILYKSSNVKEIVYQLCGKNKRFSDIPRIENVIYFEDMKLNNSSTSSRDMTCNKLCLEA